MMEESTRDFTKEDLANVEAYMKKQHETRIDLMPKICTTCGKPPEEVINEKA